MAVTAKAYGNLAKHLAEAKINFPSDTIKCMLLTSSYTPDQDAHDFVDDVTNEVAGEGYTAGGKALTGVAVTYDAETNTVKVDADDVVWADSTITARHAVFYKDTGDPETSPLISYADFGEDVISSAGNFKVELDAAGLVTLSAA
jgi:hypothetical protein